MGLEARGLVGGLIRQLMVLVQDDRRVALIGGENEDVGLVQRERSADFSDLERLGCWKFGIRDVS